MKILGWVCIVILLGALILVNKLLAEAVIMTVAINDSGLCMIAAILLGFIVSFCVSSIILKLIYKVYKNICKITFN